MSSLSARLLVLTVFFIMLSEFLIYTPSIARYRKIYLEDRVAAAHLATLALEATPYSMLSKELERELLFHVGAYSVVLRQPGWKMLALSEDKPPTVDVTIDLREANFATWVIDAFKAMLQENNKVMQVIGDSTIDSSVAIEVVLEDEPMRKAMHDYSERILQLSILISLITGGLVFLSLQWLMVRPMRRITKSMTAFRERPEDASLTIPQSGRSDEIGIAERELAVMQSDLRTALQQKSRLATLGAAVAKINHDLRNSLATAVLASDRLADIDDPEVKSVMPRLYNAINHAVELCSHTLNYVSADSLDLRMSLFHLHELVAEAGSSMRSTEFDGRKITWVNGVAFELDVVADRNQLFRVFANLGRNAFQAGAGSVRVTARKDGENILVDVEDDGPGLSPMAMERLFRPFSGSTRKDGTGLGLVIARDIMSAHGGVIELLQSGNNGAIFRLELPLRHTPGVGGR